MTIHSAKLRLAVHLLEGNAVAGFLCEREPLDCGPDLDRVILGAGYFDATGGLFKVVQRGWIDCIAVDWEGQPIVTRPQYLPIFGTPGQQAKCGPLQLEANGAAVQ